MKPPSKATLDKYGLTAEEFLAMVDAQDGKCGVCKGPLVGHLVNIDHHHVQHWKRMPPERRRQFVRALLHARCNRFLLGPTYYGFKAAHFRLAADYLDRWTHLEGPGKAPGCP